VDLLSKGQQALRIGRRLFNPDYVHDVIKPSILSQVKKITPE
jgi:hypothetical protein